MLRRILGEDIACERQLAPDLAYVFADRNQVEQVLINLVVNARDAMPNGGKLIIETRNVDLCIRQLALEAGVTPGKYVRLVVTDNGQGMNEATSAQVFEPFFTTKERGKGTGLGLATVYGIVQKCGGNITVDSKLGRGTTFAVFFPKLAVVPPPSLPSHNAPPTTVAAGSETILVVEDDDDLREVVRRHLAEAGYDVLVAADGLQAVQLAYQRKEPIALLLTDVIMPHMNGSAVAEEIRRQRPAIKVLFTSGYTDNALAHHGVLDQNVHLLTKPFTAAALLHEVRSRLDERADASLV